MDSSFWNDTESVSTRHSETPDLWSGVLLVAARARFSVTQLLVVSILTIARVARCTDNVKGVVDEQLVGVFWVRIRKWVHIQTWFLNSVRDTGSRPRLRSAFRRKRHIRDST
jgi:hypothetical protein